MLTYLRELRDGGRLRLFDGSFELIGRHVGDAHRLFALMAGYLGVHRKFGDRPRLAGHPRFKIDPRSGRGLELLQQLAHAANRTSLDAIGELRAPAVVRSDARSGAVTVAVRSAGTALCDLC